MATHTIQDLQEELAKTRSALEAYTALPPHSVKIEGSPLCTRFFIHVFSPIKQIKPHDFAKVALKILPAGTDIYAVDRNHGFGEKGNLFLFEAFIATYQYTYIPTIATALYNALLQEGYFETNSVDRNIAIINLERTADAICVSNDIINMQKTISGSDQGSVINMSSSGELQESPAIVIEKNLDPYYERVRREYPIVQHRGCAL